MRLAEKSLEKVAQLTESPLKNIPMRGIIIIGDVEDFEMLRRKIETQLMSWKEMADKKPLVIKGCRQCGKTYIVRKFANENYENVIYLNFFANPEYKSIFEGSLDIDDLVMLMSAVLGYSGKFVPHKTIIIFDEIQECPEARTSLKFWKEDGRYDIVATGSLLGIRGYGKPLSVPVGYEMILQMFPLDFEEFLWANEISEEVISKLKQYFEDRTPVPEALHKRMSDLLLQYTVVGGMPAVVREFVENHNMSTVLDMQRMILDEYREDMIKYANPADKPSIVECFNSIPKQLSKENKKFQYSVVKKGSTASKFLGSLQWIEDAGIIARCYNLEITELPLDGNSIQDVFKVYTCDTGLFIAMLEDGTQYDVLKGNLYAYKGAVFENLIADVFTKMKRKLYYYHKDSGLEVDFVTRWAGECVLVEVKATTGNTKSSRTILKHPEKYHVNKCIKIGNYNVSESDGIITIPTYMSFLITDY